MDAERKPFGQQGWQAWALATVLVLGLIALGLVLFVTQ